MVLVTLTELPVLGESLTPVELGEASEPMSARRDEEWLRGVETDFDRKCDGWQAATDN